MDNETPKTSQTKPKAVTSKRPNPDIETKEITKTIRVRKQDGTVLEEVKVIKIRKEIEISESKSDSPSQPVSEKNSRCMSDCASKCNNPFSRSNTVGAALCHKRSHNQVQSFIINTNTASDQCQTAASRTTLLRQFVGSSSDFPKNSADEISKTDKLRLFENQNITFSKSDTGSPRTSSYINMTTTDDPSNEYEDLYKNEDMKVQFSFSENPVSTDHDDGKVTERKYEFTQQSEYVPQSDDPKMQHDTKDIDDH